MAAPEMIHADHWDVVSSTDRNSQRESRTREIPGERGSRCGLHGLLSAVAKQEPRDPLLRRGGIVGGQQTGKNPRGRQSRSRTAAFKRVDRRSATASKLRRMVVVEATGNTELTEELA